MDEEQKSPPRKPGAKKRASKSASKAREPVSIRPTARKIGESDDNLSRRAEWFRRRTIGDKEPG